MTELSPRLPSLETTLQRPFTGALCISAVAVTLYSWKVGHAPDAFVMSPDAVLREPWRLVACALPHSGLMHLLFNVYWTVILGGYLEEKFGALRSIAFCVVVQCAALGAEYAFVGSGVGLSGIGYGFFGFFAIAGRRSPKYDALDRNTVISFSVWFLLCIALTVTNTMRIANVAHGVGALAGALIALVVTSQSAASRAGWGGLLFVVVAVGVGGASRPVRLFVNLSGDAVEAEAALGFGELEKGHPSRAYYIYQRVLARESGDADWWHNFGVACARTQRRAEAIAAFERAQRLDPSSAARRESLALSYGAGAAELRLAGNGAEALRLERRATELAPGFAEAWLNYGVSLLEYQHDGRAALAAFGHAHRLAPDDPEAKAGIKAARHAIAEDLYAHQRFGEAAEHFEEIAEGPDATDDDWYNTAVAYAAAGDPESAVVAVNRALALAPDSQPALDLLAELREAR